MPEPFFADTAARIAFTFSFLVLALFFICLACIRRSGKRSRKAGKAALSLALLLALAVPSQTAHASEEWPEDVSIEADAGIVMDAASGTVLYGKNIHETYAPASITKVLTSIIVLEQCDLDEVVTFSKNAVYNVEADSSSAGYDTGDTATVKDCLYALLLKSANESANALAEHTAGSTEAFAELMNEKAKELGCVDSHFANPSGLNDENHYVSAYDMALITRYAFQNETFREIASTTYYELPPNARNPEGLGVSPGNKMVKKNFPEYRPDVLGGKTGYTSIALNTLVIGARRYRADYRGAPQQRNYLLGHQPPVRLWIPKFPLRASGRKRYLLGAVKQFPDYCRASHFPGPGSDCGSGQPHCTSKPCGIRRDHLPALL